MYGFIKLEYISSSRKIEEIKERLQELAYEYQISIWFSKIDYRCYDEDIHKTVLDSQSDIVQFSLEDTYAMMELIEDFMHETLEDYINNMDDYLCNGIKVTKDEYTDIHHRREYF